MFYNKCTIIWSGTFTHFSELLGAENRWREDTLCLWDLPSISRAPSTELWQSQEASAAARETFNQRQGLNELSLNELSKDRA